jgi:hypothetical protein
MTNDLFYFDGLESIELTIGSNAHQVQALRRPLVPRFDGGTQIDRAAWHVRAADLQGNVPAVGNVLEVGAESWTVTQVERLSFGTRFKLVCEKTSG